MSLSHSKKRILTVICLCIFLLALLWIRISEAHTPPKIETIWDKDSGKIKIKMTIEVIDSTKSSYITGLPALNTLAMAAKTSPIISDALFTSVSDDKTQVQNVKLQEIKTDLRSFNRHKPVPVTEIKSKTPKSRLKLVPKEMSEHTINITGPVFKYDSKVEKIQTRTGSQVHKPGSVQESEIKRKKVQPGLMPINTETTKIKIPAPAPQVTPIRDETTIQTKPRSTPFTPESIKEIIIKQESQQSVNLAFDLVAERAYLKDTNGNDVSTPTVGQGVYFYADWHCDGSGTTPSFRSEFRLDGSLYAYREGTATGGYSYTTYVNSTWTATAGTHTLEWILDINYNISETNEGNNTASKGWTTSGFDLVAEQVYLKDNNGNELDTPTLGQDIYFYVDWRCDGTGSTPTFRSEFRLDGGLYSYREGTATGGYSYTSSSGPWTATAGTHTLERILDVYDAVNETDEGNNTASKHWTTSGFDLVAERVYLKDTNGNEVNTPTVGQDVYFYADWRCDGSGSTPTFRSEFRLDGSMYAYREGTAEGGYSYVTNANSPWDATSGTHMLEWILDINNTVSETDESNNTDTKTWTTSDLFDLVAERVYLKDNNGNEVDTPTVGQDVYFYANWRCDGSGSTPTFRSEFRLDGSLYAYREGTAEGGHSYTIFINSPWSATSGAHELKWILDVNYNVTETNENNNSIAKQFDVGGKPDLIVDSYWRSASEIIEGTSFWVKVRIKNDGNADAGSSHARTFLSLDQKLDLNVDHELERKPVSTLSPGSYEDVRWDISSFPNLSSGDYNVWIIFDLDCDEEVDESIENNNIYITSNSILVHDGGDPDIDVRPTSLTINQTSMSSGNNQFNQNVYQELSSIPPIDSKYIIRTFIGKDGNEIMEVIVPGKPPENYRAPAAKFSASAITLPNMPAYDWSFGCSATSAAMMAGHYDNMGYPDMYTGPTNSGIMPMDNSVWGDVIINGETRHQCPLSATRKDIDGRTIRGHVDDYWIKYDNSGPDPYITNGWTEHILGECTADFMGTNQSYWSNNDGSTTFFFYTNGSPLHDYTDCEYKDPPKKDGCHGMRVFFESRGYTVIDNYTQLIYGYGGNTKGFTYSQFKQEIDAGRPVMIQVEGHSMVGYGYDDNSNTIYIHDTWDYQDHTMTWGGNYSGMKHYAVTVVELEPAMGMDNYFTIYNVGKGTLTVNSIADDRNWLSTASYPSVPFNIQPSDSQRVTVQVDWNLLSTTDQGTVSIGSNDPDESTVYVSVTANPGGGNPELSVNPDSYHAPASGGSEIITVTNSGSGGTFTWTASADWDWISVSPTSGIPDETFTITVQPNSGATRSGTVTVSAPGVSGSPKYIQVTQDGSGGQHFTPVWTGNPYQPMTIYCTKALLNDQALVAGDEIGIFDGNKCVGAQVLSQTPTQTNPVEIICSKDDGTGNGFIEGNTIIFKVWDQSVASEYSASAQFIDLQTGLPISPVPFTGLATAVVKLTAYPFVPQSIPLKTGWNIFSLAVTPQGSHDMLDVLSPILNNLVKVIDEQGHSIVKLFGNWTNSIGDWQTTEGYYINVNQDVTLLVTGTEITTPLSIPLKAGWNIISYPCLSVSQNALNVVQPLINSGNLIKVIDEQGHSIVKIFGNWSNSIGDMHPGEGYYVNVNANCTLTITCSGVNLAANLADQLKYREPKHFQLESTGYPFEPMNIFVIEACVNGEHLNVGDEIAIYDGDQCIGISVLSNRLSVAGPIEIIASKDDGKGIGFNDGDQISFRVWRSNTGEELFIDVSGVQHFDPNRAQLTAASVFEGLGTAVVAINLSTTSVADNLEMPQSYHLYQNHPNPFNPTTKISYDLPEATDVKLEIFDLQGNMVRRFVEGHQGAGHHTIEWNGRNSQGIRVVSGIYFYKLTSGKFVANKKMILTK